MSSLVSPITSKDDVAASFDAVARRYDLLQRLNPGYHADLRRSAARLEAPERGRILDLCCGTGLSTDALVRRYPAADVTALDGSHGMLERARGKARLRQVRFLEGDAHDPARAGALGPFDAVFMAYGIRNMSDPDACLRNMLALLAPGGRAAFHEYVLDGSRSSRAIWNVVAAGVITPLGWAASGSSELFRYLRRSVLDFDGVERFEARLRQAGFAQVQIHRMPGWQRGILHTVVACKPA